jgi:hypothetical protein
MTRRNSALISVLTVLAMAIAAVPAAAITDYSSVNALTGDQTVQPYNPPKDYGSVTAIGGGSSTAQPGQASGFRSLNSITSGSGTEATPQLLPSVQAPEESGFDWGDALIGALVASGLLSLAFVAARSVARHRRAAAESHV